jgi:hypothetical protein
MTWWDRCARSTRIAIAVLLFGGGSALVVISASYGYADREFLVSWFSGYVPYITGWYATLTIALGGAKAYFITRRPTGSPPVEGKEGGLKGTAVEAVYDALTYASQFAIATLTLVLLLQGKLGGIPSLDQWGLYGLLAFLYFTSGAGVSKQIEYVGPKIVGPSEIPTEAKEKGLAAKPVAASGTQSATVAVVVGGPVSKSPEQTK